MTLLRLVSALTLPVLRGLCALFCRVCVRTARWSGTQVNLCQSFRPPRVSRYGCRMTCVSWQLSTLRPQVRGYTRTHTHTHTQAARMRMCTFAAVSFMYICVCVSVCVYMCVYMCQHSTCASCLKRPPTCQAGGVRSHTLPQVARGPRGCQTAVHVHGTGNMVPGKQVRTLCVRVCVCVCLRECDRIGRLSVMHVYVPLVEYVVLSISVLCVCVCVCVCVSRTRYVKRKFGMSQGEPTVSVVSVDDTHAHQTGPGDLLLLKGHGWPDAWVSDCARAHTYTHTRTHTHQRRCIRSCAGCLRRRTSCMSLRVSVCVCVCVQGLGAVHRSPDVDTDPLTHTDTTDREIMCDTYYGGLRLLLTIDEATPCDLGTSHEDQHTHTSHKDHHQHGGSCGC